MKYKLHSLTIFVDCLKRAKSFYLVKSWGAIKKFGQSWYEEKNLGWNSKMHWNVLKNQWIFNLKLCGFTCDNIR